MLTTIYSYAHLVSISNGNSGTRRCLKANDVISADVIPGVFAINIKEATGSNDNLGDSTPFATIMRC